MSAAMLALSVRANGKTGTITPYKKVSVNIATLTAAMIKALELLAFDMARKASEVSLDSI